MNIVICGLQGTGKTTLSKKIVEELNFNYINDYSILKNTKNSCKSDIINFIKSNDNYVIDLCYSLSPCDCSKLNCIVYFLGFSSIDTELLYNLMTAKGENVTKSQIEKNITLSQQYQKECEKFNIPFYDINKDRSIILDCIFKDIKSKLNY